MVFKNTPHLTQNTIIWKVHLRAHDCFHDPFSKSFFFLTTENKMIFKGTPHLTQNTVIWNVHLLPVEHEQVYLASFALERTMVFASFQGDERGWGMVVGGGGGGAGDGGVWLSQCLPTSGAEIEVPSPAGLKRRN